MFLGIPGRTLFSFSSTDQASLGMPILLGDEGAALTIPEAQWQWLFLQGLILKQHITYSLREYSRICDKTIIIIKNKNQAPFS